MIDTDKYEGHAYSNPPWKWEGNKLYSWVAPEPLVIGLENEWKNDEATMQLIADAPLLLEEVKRLREQLAKAKKYVYIMCRYSDSILMDYEDYIKGDEEE